MSRESIAVDILANQNVLVKALVLKFGRKANLKADERGVLERHHDAEIVEVLCSVEELDIANKWNGTWFQKEDKSVSIRAWTTTEQIPVQDKAKLINDLSYLHMFLTFAVSEVEYDNTEIAIVRLNQLINLARSYREELAEQAQATNK